MNVSLHHVAQRAVHELMTLNRAQTFEILRNDSYTIMSATVASPRVPGMQVAVVGHFDPIGVQLITQQLANAIGSRARLGRLADAHFDSSGGLSSRGILEASHTNCSAMKTTINAMVPKTLNLTQTSVLNVRTM